MTPSDYDYLCSFLLGSSGLSLGTNKEYLVKSRLIPLAQSWNLADLTELVATLRRGGDPQLRIAVTEAMTTNETSFFRDRQPFEDLKNELLPDMLADRKISRRLRIWCAATATGQEPYTIAMLLNEFLPDVAQWRIEIVATDIAHKALDRAKSGLYSQFEVQRGLPIQLMMKYFDQVPQGWQVKDRLRKMITWKQLNLLDRFSHLGRFDIVFCRNVLIYFETETKTDILNRVRDVIAPDGYLFLGAAETVLGICDRFQRHSICRSAVYRPDVAVRT